MPKLFSEREGIKKEEKELQVGDISNELRTRLWNALEVYYWEYIATVRSRILHYRPLFAELMGPNTSSETYYIIKGFLYRMWDSYFRRPVDELGPEWIDKWDWAYNDIIKKHFSSCEWYEVYDFLEFVVNSWPDQERNKKFMEYCNWVLEEENAGYRFVNGMIVPIYEKTEIAEIEDAFENVSPWEGVRHDLSSALKHLSDREHPNYKDSIVASIRAVEGVAKLITHRHGTLGELTHNVQQILELNEHFAKAIGQLWRYANTVARHSDPEGEKMPEFEDAKFIFVTSCAIINYLIAKANKKGVELKLE
ncbi:MAG: hypothetical protein H0Z28_13880 [Archaeoglobus sp.]|nr:hypothetical protein [Archaeoglobus sp.]